MKIIKAPMRTVDMQTGEVTEDEVNWGLILSPPSPGNCQVCDHAHDPGMPHYLGTMYYAYSFHAEHGRFPTWRDAMAHCSPEAKAAAIEVLERSGISLDGDDLHGNSPNEENES